MTFERKVRLARLPEMRLAYFESKLSVEADGTTDYAQTAGLWDDFNDWRLRVRPALGRIDIAAIGWLLDMEPQDGQVRYRMCVPIRSDYSPPPPAKTTFFPGGALAYCYSDNVDEIAEAFEAVDGFLAESGMVQKSGGIEVYKFHYNLEQHPSDCGVLVTLADGRDPLPASSHASPLNIARD